AFLDKRKAEPAELFHPSSCNAALERLASRSQSRPPASAHRVLFVAKRPSIPGGWLFKEEPSTYSYAMLEKDGVTLWTGIKNALARQYLRQVRAGDRVLYYHTGTERAIVGEMRVMENAADDPE